ncbi:LacI family DNA-binding transcriptional regulator [Paractinoplanes rishiriensis]|uniref:LacI family transcriptional regulator n=1 Tax=Paractinoplanes rishiriensis TaxID=1050105 RepID=A0A919MXR1_9ACTN|nr:LacI family DNA-binding transcriptional regulator [Actinoplanes rishiriensis]GIE99218.1 LacI family transcriptional regulator [Actinoplanes rishiriensis]
MDRLTIKDVARAAGVHPATASRALDPRLPGRISPATTERVVRAAAELGYVVDPVGRSLRTQRSGTVGVLVPDLLNPFYPPVVRGVQNVLREHGFEGLIASTDNDLRRGAELLDLFRARRCEGYVIASAGRRDAAVAALAGQGVPMVLVNRLTEVDVPSVTSDDACGIRNAVTHLRALGHTAIGHVAGPAGISVTGTRAAAYRAALRTAGITPRPAWVVRAGQYTAAAGEVACRGLLERGEVTAILAGNDMIAVGCLAAIAERGLRCPQDVSLVGINNMPLAEWLRPPLTTVAIAQEELGAQAARLVLARIVDPRADAGSVALATELIVRESTGPVRPAARS